MKLKTGQIYYINFKGSVGREINSIHLGVIFTLPNIKDVVLCIPLTSPKIKHFKTENDFNTRNYNNVKHFSWQYLKQTDSIAMLDQMKTISIKRLIHFYQNQDNQLVELDDDNITLLKEKLIKYIKQIIS